MVLNPTINTPIYFSAKKNDANLVKNETKVCHHHITIYLSLT